MEPSQGVAVFIEMLLVGRQFAEEIIEASVLWRCLVFLVEHVVGKLCRQLHRTEEERHGFLHVSALLVMVPAKELDVGYVDFLRVVRSVVLGDGIVDEILFILIERDVRAITLLAFGSESLPDASAGDDILEVSGDAECQLLGILHVLELVGEARLVESVVYFVGEFCIILIYVVWFLVWMHSHPLLGENYLFHIVRLFVIRGYNRCSL